MRHLIAAASLLALAACGLNGTDNEQDKKDAAAADHMSIDDNRADSMRSNDPAEGAQAAVDIPDTQERPLMQAQVVLDRQGFGPGVIDGKMGASTKNALKGFQEANGLDVTGELDDETKAALGKWSNIPATRVVTIPADWGQTTYAETPDNPEDQAKLQILGYQSLDERLAERFHTTVETLKMLNPGGLPAGAGQVVGSATTSASPDADKTSSFTAGQQVRTPNIGADRIDDSRVLDKGWLVTLSSLGVGTDQPQVAKVVVDKSEGWLKGYDTTGKLVALFTVTTGSSHDPLPLGTWGITGIGHNPPFTYNPDLFWDVPDSNEKQELPPGPNGPVGVVWIDLTKEHYGIHGTPEPQTIGRTQSHGCVRLTNWDAARLAQMVDTKTKVVFQA
ncbi:L,D-transpeptidase family protein [Altererythrobacter salegens]|uniref:L,D-transpeptidase family protein n=1 Tax=Croceibacterium salegens TaxID=1737568 RepID=A0A6I4SS99_9SPHN|nr:L,D-transpeptidase family protein [Croceibacterium salegens]MXO58715.1 L,D-transpeptidase family protein [Croceibacterium salegens]